MKKRYTKYLSMTAIFLGASAFMDAQTLMINFGETAPTGSNLTNSPLHTADGTFTDTVWNTQDNTDTASLLWSDNTTASGLILYAGQSDNSTTTADMTAINPDSVSDLGGATSTGIYAGDSVGTGGIFGPSGGDLGAALQLVGLSAGTYDVYLSGRNTSTGAGGHPASYTFAVGVGTGGVPYDYNYSGYASQTITFSSPTDAIGAWVEGENYVKFTLELAKGETLNIAGAGNRGFINSLQVTAIPEPSSYALGFGITVFAFLGCRRRRA